MLFLKNTVTRIHAEFYELLQTFSEKFSKKNFYSKIIINKLSTANGSI